MIVKSLPTGPLEVNCYIVGCEATGKAMVIDPGGDVPAILALAAENDLTVVCVVNTHGHFDHIGGNRRLLEATRAELMIHAADRPLLERADEHAAVFGLTAEPSPAPDRELVDGEILRLGELEFKVIHTPGHSPGGICLWSGDYVFVGDTLFAGSVGRTDLPGGDHAALIRNIREKLLLLPEPTRVCPGHGPLTTIGREKDHNPFLL